MWSLQSYTPTEAAQYLSALPALLTQSFPFLGSSGGRYSSLGGAGRVAGKGARGGSALSGSQAWASGSEPSLLRL